MTIVCDLDGVVYVDGGAVPGAGAALSELQAQGKRLLFVTNNATKTALDVVETVHSLTGFGVEEGDVVTSALVTAMALDGVVERVLIVGGPALTETFRACGFVVVSDWRQAEAVVCGMDFDLTYDKLAAATLAVRAGGLFYATNADATYPSREGLKPGGGAILAALETATDTKAVVCGKPNDPAGDAVERRAGAGGVLIVGDRFDTDIALGKARGWFTALVLTGVAPSPDAPRGLEPDLVLDSLADLPAALAEAQTR